METKMKMKMKKWLAGFTALVSFGAPATAQQQPAQPAQPAAAAQARPDADPAMWVVRDEDTTIYLFGTFHLLDGRADWFNDEVREAFDRSQELVFEVPMPGDQAEMAALMQPLIARYAIDPNGRKISADLTEAENRVLNEALTGMGVPAGAFDSFEPWFVSLTLTAALAQKMGMDAQNGAEEVLRRAAQSRNMTIGGLETMEGQIQMMDAMPREAQLKGLKDMLADMNAPQETLGRMLAVWNAGDAEGLERVMNESMRENPEMRRALLENRNRAWAEWIDQRLDRPGTVFMAVGAGHLTGDDSVQTFLRQRDIASERVPQLTPNR